MCKQRAQEGLVTSTQKGWVWGMGKERTPPSEEGRKLRKTKAPYMEGGYFCFNKPLVCCDFIQRKLG